LDEILETHIDVGCSTTTTLHLMLDDEEELSVNTDDSTWAGLESGFHSLDRKRKIKWYWNLMNGAQEPGD